MSAKKAKKLAAEESPQSYQNLAGTNPMLQAVQEAIGIVSNLEEDNIEAGSLRSILEKMGVTVSDKEFQELLLKTGMAKDGTVNFNTFMAALGKMYHFTELTVLKDVIEGIDKIDQGKVLVHELPSFVKKMGIQLTDKEFQQALQKVSVDGSEKVIVKDFVKVLTNIPHFSDLLVLKDTIKAVSCIQGEKISLHDLKPTLVKMGIHLKPLEYEEIIRITPTDRDGKLDIGQVMKKISKTERFKDMKVLNNTLTAIHQFKDGRAELAAVKACLSNIGVHFPETELAEAAKSLQFSPEGTVDVKELILALKGAKRFANCVAVHDTVRALKLVKECKEAKVRRRKEDLNTFGLRMANQVVTHVLRSAHMTGARQAKFNDFIRALMRNEKFSASAELLDAFAILKKVAGGMIGVEDLKVVMKNFNIDIPPEEISEALAFCTIDSNNRVNLKEFIKGVTHTNAFLISPELQLICLVLSKLKDEHFDLLALEASLDTMDLPEAKELLQEVMKTAKVNQQGKVNFKEFIRIFLLLPAVPQESVLKETFNAMNKMKDSRIPVGDLGRTLAGLDIQLTPKELQELQSSVRVSDDGTLDFNDVVMELTGTQSFAEFNAIQDTFSAINKICNEKIKKEDLPAVVAQLHIPLSPEELQAVLASAPIDESGMIEGTEFLKILDEAPHFTEFVALQDAMKVVENVKQEKMNPEQLRQALEDLGVHLTSQAFDALVSTAKVDENGEINFKDFLLALGETPEFTELEALQQATTMIDAAVGSHLQLKELEATLENSGIRLRQEEFQQAVQNIQVAADGTINLKDFLMSLAKIQRFSDSKALHSATEAFSKIKGEKVEESELKSVMEFLGVWLSNREFEKALEHVSVDENSKVNFKDFLVSVMENERFSEPAAIHHAYSVFNKVQDDKIEISELKDVPGAITLTDEEVREALDYVAVDDDGKVEMKKFMSALPNLRRFSKLTDVEKAMETMKQIKQDQVDVKTLDTIMGRMDVHLSPSEMKQALKCITRNDDGRVSLKYFVTGLAQMEPFGQAEKDRVAVKNLDSILQSMGLSLTKEEMEEALKQVTVDEDGNIDLSAFMNSVKLMKQRSRAAGAPGSMVAVEGSGSFLSSMGIQLNKEQLEEMLKHMSVDENGKVNMNELMNYVLLTRTDSQAERDRVPVGNLDAVLINMGIFLTDDEIQEALRYVTIDGDGKVNLNGFLKGVKIVQRAAEAEGKTVAADDLNSALAEMGIHLTEEEMEEVLKHVAFDAEGKLNLKRVLETVMATRRPSMFEKDRVDVQNLEGILASAGIYLTAKELQEALKYAPVDADGKVNLAEFMKGVREVQPCPRTADEGGVKRNVHKLPQIKRDGWVRESRVDIDNLDAVLEEMGVHLNNKQLYEALKYAPMDADGKVDVEAFKRGVRAIMKTEQRMDVNKLKGVLPYVGIHLTQHEMQQALKLATVNEDGTVNLKDFLWAAQAIPSIQNKKVETSNLSSLLAALGIYLRHEELQDALKMTRLNEDGTVNLNEFIRACNATLTLPSTRTRYLSRVPDAKMLRLPNLLERHHFQTEGRSGAAKNLTHLQLEAFRKAYDTFCKDLDGKIHLPSLETTADNLGISLTEEEAFEELVYADTDGDGRVNFTDFLNVVTDSKRFIQAVAPRKGSMKTVDARGILFFELLSKLVETSALPKKATMTIVSYYRQKFLESTGKKACLAPEKPHHWGRKESPLRKNASSSLAAFAGAGRIVVMKDKELDSFVRSLQEKAPCSDSPYAQVPIFPLIPNRDYVMEGKPKKELQKLEAQRRMEPISTFEDHFFHKRRWMPENKPSRAHRASLTLSPELKSKDRHLTLQNLDDIRREVKKATDTYQKALALRERNKTLKLWRRLRGGEIGLETGNPSFYQTFSTYSWSWNVCQELVTPRELREYDNHLYNSFSRSSISASKQIKAGRKWKGSKK